MKHPSKRSRTRVDWGTGAPRPGCRDTTRRHFVRTLGWSAGGSAGGEADGLWTDNRLRIDTRCGQTTGWGQTHKRLWTDNRCGNRKDVEDTRERKTKEKERHYLWKHIMRGGDYVRGGESWGGSWDRTGRSAKIDFDWTALQWSEVIANLEQVSIGFCYIIFYTFYTDFFFLFRWFQLLSVVYCHTRIHTEKLANKRDEFVIIAQIHSGYLCDSTLSLYASYHVIHPLILAEGLLNRLFFHSCYTSTLWLYPFLVKQFDSLWKCKILLYEIRPWLTFFLNIISSLFKEKKSIIVFVLAFIYSCEYFSRPLVLLHRNVIMKKYFAWIFNFLF